MSRNRFVVLRHDVGSGFSRTTDDHFDWMFESNGVLITWSTAPIDRFRGHWRLACQRLAEHRLAYLEFQGDLTGNRGSVRRVLAGRADLLHNDQHRFLAELEWRCNGQAACGRVEIQRNVSDESSSADEIRGDWLLEFTSG